MRSGAAILAALALLAVPGCGDGDKPPKSPAPPPPAVPQPPTDLPAGVPASVTFSQIMVVYAVPTVDGRTRTRDEAWELARSLLRRIQEGEAFGAVLFKHTDDREPDGRIFNDGSYSKGWNDPHLNAAVKAVVFRLPVGAVAPDPVDTGLAFLILRRDA